MGCECKTAITGNTMKLIGIQLLALLCAVSSLALSFGVMDGWLCLLFAAPNAFFLKRSLEMYDTENVRTYIGPAAGLVQASALLIFYLR